MTRMVLNKQLITEKYAITEYGLTLKNTTSVITDRAMQHRPRIMSYVLVPIQRKTTLFFLNNNCFLPYYLKTLATLFSIIIN
jgi:hypothetical protein